MKRQDTALANLLLFATSAVAQLPYNPAQLILAPDAATIYEFSSSGGLHKFDISQGITASGGSGAVQSLPISSNTSLAYSAVADAGGISLLAGSCQDEGSSAQLWRIAYDSDIKTEDWKQEQITTTDDTLRTYFLSAGFSFSPTARASDAGLYYFGGMCPHVTADVANWTANAAYSNTMVTLSPNGAPKYTSVGKLSPPIAEAGLTITALDAVVSNSSSGAVSQTQSFVLIGGHTANAFINMSQVAVYSLPGGVWTFKGINQPDGAQGELVRRSNSIVEPRSGHTALLSDDKTKIIVFGGWVGDITNAAEPQLAVLELGDQYGTSNTWTWDVPIQTGSPFGTGSGTYGHGAVMLPGNVMMVSGGNSIGKPKAKRDGDSFYLYNVTSATWLSSYVNPSTTAAAKTVSHSSKAGLGAGLGIGLAAVAGLAVVGYLYARGRKQKRVERERRLRALALGSGRYNSESQISGIVGHSQMRSASWANAQERHIESAHHPLPYPPSGLNTVPDYNEQTHDAERTGLDLHAPSPTRGLRRNLHSRGPGGYGNHFQPAPTGPGAVFRIDEEEEERSLRSMQLRTPGSRHSDPFKDPQDTESIDQAAEQRKKEVKGWMEDWQSAAMSLSRNPSQARTYSNLSQTQSFSQNGSDRGRASPDKSDRTNSNLSDRSTLSNSSAQPPHAVSRTVSQRSVSAGLALFTGAAAAMGRFAGTNRSELERSASKRSISMNGAARYSRQLNGDNQSLLRDDSPTKSDYALYFTPPESPIKDYKNYSRPTNLTNRVRARGVLGSMKRVFTGTSQVDVDAKVEHYEEREKEALETTPEMVQSTGSGSAIPFWQGMKGAKDWKHEKQQMESSTIRRRSGGQDSRDPGHVEHDGEDWDIETAIQQRVVQVMFTVPKEKLRVVNADALSLISRSDIGDKDDDRDWDIKRMSSVRENDEPEHSDKSRTWET